MMNKYCYICYGVTEEELQCDTCDEYYCPGCSYTFSLHYQFQGCRCFRCADQMRLLPILKDQLRNNKIEFIKQQDE